jgi:hypothetical protein
MAGGGYKREKMAAGLELLAAGLDPLRDRLTGLYPTTLMRLKPEDFEHPEERALFESCKAALIGPGPVAETVEAMDDVTAKKTAEDFYELYLRVFKVYPYGERSAR